MVHAIWATVVWATLSVHAPTVEVNSERVRLAHLVPRMPEPWASVDLGAAPEPLQHRIVTSNDIARKISLARLEAAPLPLPGRTEVLRAGTNFTEPELRTMLQEALIAQLPAPHALRSLSVSGGIVVGAGEVQVDLNMLQLHEGKQTIMATVQSADGIARSVPMLVDIHRTIKASGPVITRGQDIVIVLTQGSVRVQSSGIAQGPGAIGEIIAVMPTSGTRVLHGRVVDARTVEVQG